MTLGTRLHNYRRKAGLSVRDMSKRTGLGIGTISHAENDQKDIRVSSLIKMLDATGNRKHFRL